MSLRQHQPELRLLRQQLYEADIQVNGCQNNFFSIRVQFFTLHKDQEAVDFYLNAQIAIKQMFNSKTYIVAQNNSTPPVIEPSVKRPKHDQPDQCNQPDSHFSSSCIRLHTRSMADRGSLDPKPAR